MVRVLMREWLAQARAISESRHPERLRLLAAAESAGALVATEIGYYGIPFNVQAHHEHLCELLGPRPVPGERPQKNAGVGGADSAHAVYAVVEPGFAAGSFACSAVCGGFG